MSNNSLPLAYSSYKEKLDTFAYENTETNISELNTDELVKNFFINAERSQKNAEQTSSILLAYEQEESIIRMPVDKYDVVVEDGFWVIRRRDDYAKSTLPKSRRAIMLEQVAVYEQLHPELKKTHLGQYVAIHKGELIDSDSDKFMLLHRLDEKLPDKSRVVLVRQVQSELPQPIRASSALYKLSPR